MEIDWTPFSIFDQLLKNWKADWKGNDSYFNQPYFDCHLQAAASHYVGVMAIWIAQVYFEEMNLQALEYKHEVELAMKLLYENVFPFCSQWSKTKNLYMDISQMILSYQGKKPAAERRGNMFGYLFLPETAQIFKEWRFKAGYTQIDALCLYLAAPYMEILFDIPGR